MTKFASKEEGREAIWSALEDEGAARFPFPPKGRIPNFSGAEAAARRLMEHPLFVDAKTVKINPDSPQRPLREAALRAGKTLMVPTPRLKAGFLRFDPAQIDEDDMRDASMISRWAPFGDEVALEAMPPVDLIVTGCVAVTPDGGRLGKGHGYSDLEYAILQELGQPPVPVVTTVHELQVVEGFPAASHDLKLSVVASPERVIDCGVPNGGAMGIDWSKLDAEDLEAMPILQELKDRL